MTSYPTDANARHWWLTTVPRWKRLHAVPGDALDRDDEDAVEALCAALDPCGEDEGPLWPVLTAACGWAGEMTMPGVFSRLAMDRCAHCCRKLGIKPGRGTPANEAQREKTRLQMVD